jgi:hypothetical protein
VSECVSGGWAIRGVTTCAALMGSEHRQQIVLLSERIGMMVL